MKRIRKLLIIIYCSFIMQNNHVDASIAWTKVHRTHQLPPRWLAFSPYLGLLVIGIINHPKYRQLIPGTGSGATYLGNDATVLMQLLIARL